MAQSLQCCGDRRCKLSTFPRLIAHVVRRRREHNVSVGGRRRRRPRIADEPPLQRRALHLPDATLLIVFSFFCFNSGANGVWAPRPAQSERKPSLPRMSPTCGLVENRAPAPAAVRRPGAAHGDRFSSRTVPCRRAPPRTRSMRKIMWPCGEPAAALDRSKSCRHLSARSADSRRRAPCDADHVGRGPLLVGERGPGTPMPHTPRSRSAALAIEISRTPRNYPPCGRHRAWRQPPYRRRMHHPAGPGAVCFLSSSATRRP